MIAERDALKTDDPEIARLTNAADRAISEGAIVTARQFLDDAVKRVEATQGAVDAAEEQVKQQAPRRRADLCAARRRRVARLRLSRRRRRLWQGLRARREVGRQAQMELQEPRGRGASTRMATATGDRQSLSTRAIAAYESDPDLHPQWREEPRLGDHPQQHGGRPADARRARERHRERSKRRPQIFGELLDVFAREKDDPNWAAAQNNLGNVAPDARPARE